MSSQALPSENVVAPSKGLVVALWIGQVILAAMFLMAGGMKLANAGEIPYPQAFTYFVGTAELLGAIGVVVPALTRIKPKLTPLAATGLATIMVLATGFHISRSEPFHVTAILGAIAIFVAWGRSKKAPVRAR